MTNKLILKLRLDCMILVAIFCLALPTVCKSDDSNEMAATRVVQQFCQAEFEGDDLRLREQLIMLSREHETELRKQKAPIAAIVLDLNGDSLYVVRSYRVQDVKVNGDRGTATVVYTRLAKQDAVEATSNEKRYIPRINLDHKN